MAVDELVAAIQREIDMFEIASAKDAPKRIRITDFIPEGMTFLGPYEDDGSLPVNRTIGDGGPVEVLINGNDWDRLTAELGTPVDPLRGGSIPTRVLGIPVLDERRR